MRNRLVLWLSLLIVGFLTGFIPRYARSHRLQQNVSAMAGQLDTCRSADQLSRLRSTATLMYLEATQKNYGTSGDYANRFFDQAQRLANNTHDEALSTVLRQLLTSRDQIIAGLAKGDDAVLPAMQNILAGLEQNTTQ